MPSPNQSVDLLALKSQPSSGQSESLAKSPSDSNISNNSFNEVYGRERAQVSERASDGRSEPSSGPADGGKTPANETGEQPSYAKQSGNDPATNGKALPVALPVDEELAVNLSGVPEPLPTETESDLGDESHAELNADVPAALAAGDEVIPVTEAEKTPALAAGTQSKAATIPGAPFISNQETSAKSQTPGLRAGAAESGINVKTETPSAANFASSDPKGDSNKVNLDLEIGKNAVQKTEVASTAQLSAAATTKLESTEPVGQQLRADLTQLSQQIAATQKSDLAGNRISVPLNSPDWGQAVAQRVLWLASSGVQAAQLQLHPRELGPVDVRISMVNDQAQVQFSSQYSVVRESLEASLPRLREMFDSNSVQLLDVNVSDQPLAEQESGETDEQRSGIAQAEQDDLDPLISATELSPAGVGLVDYYA